jgi:hypothetical protein
MSNNTTTKKTKPQPAKDTMLPDHISEILRPLATFYKNAQTNPDDVHVHWEAHVVRGDGETFLTMQGSSSMPSLLSRSLRAKAADMIKAELYEKIAVPVHARVQEYVNELELEVAEKALASTETFPTLSLDDVAEVSAKLKLQNQQPND